ncbi:MAG: SDR family NAD(P)-dependent oxidoreductase [Mycobacterium sp.]|uniref:SDR family oxidoreductase n=1 Tax=Mycobacterium sp. TaxID=1785 RepID=UPI003BB17D74
MTIDGKVVAITGASSGIGEATASLLAACGAKLALGARNPDKLNAVAARLSAAGGEAVAKATDVRSRGDLMEFVSLAAGTYGQLDVLVSNAGIMPVSRFDELRVDDWEAMVDVIAMPPDAVARRRHRRGRRAAHRPDVRHQAARTTGRQLV